MSGSEIEAIVSQVQRLSPDEQMLVIRRINDILAGTKPAEGLGLSYAEVFAAASGLVYGKYRVTGRRESTEEDFGLAEWHPTEEELNGE